MKRYTVKAQKWIALILSCILLLNVYGFPDFDLAAHAEDGGEHVVEVLSAAETVSEPVVLHQAAAGEPASPPEVTEVPTPAPTAAPTAVPTEAPTPVPTQAPTPAPTEVPTPVPTAEPTPVPTEVPTPVPTEVPTPVPTEVPTPVPTPVPLVLDHLSSEQTSVQFGQTVTWHFGCSGASTVSYTIVDRNGTAVAAETIHENNIRFKAAASGVYSLTVTAANDTETKTLHGRATVADGNLNTSLTTSMRYGVAGGQPLVFNFSASGGVAPYSVQTEFYRDGFRVNVETKEMQSQAISFSPTGYGTHTVKVTVTDAAGSTASAECSLPVAINEYEPEAEWKASLGGFKPSGNYAKDIVAVAKTQVGYHENERNFIIDSSGETFCYTRYGHWYGANYGIWCAMFVSFCADYAGIPTKYLPHEASCSKWVSALGSRYVAKDGYTPSAGDIVFFATKGGKTANHVGIVTRANASSVYTIEGNCFGSVKEKSYKLSDRTILGYMVMEKVMAAAGQINEVRPLNAPASTLVPEANLQIDQVVVIEPTPTPVGQGLQSLPGATEQINAVLVLNTAEPTATPVGQGLQSLPDATPSPELTIEEEPTWEPTLEPTLEPTQTPAPQLTIEREPTTAPVTQEPTATPAPELTVEEEPTWAPTLEPTEEPTATPAPELTLEEETEASPTPTPELTLEEDDFEQGEDSTPTPDPSDTPSLDPDLDPDLDPNGDLDLVGQGFHPLPGDLADDPTLAPEDLIEKQPEDYEGVLGDIAEFKVEAVEGATYQWQRALIGSDAWEDITTEEIATGYHTPVLSVPITQEAALYLYRCRVSLAITHQVEEESQPEEEASLLSLFLDLICSKAYASETDGDTFEPVFTFTEPVGIALFSVQTDLEINEQGCYYKEYILDSTYTQDVNIYPGYEDGHTNYSYSIKITDSFKHSLILNGVKLCSHIFIEDGATASIEVKDSNIIGVIWGNNANLIIIGNGNEAAIYDHYDTTIGVKNGNVTVNGSIVLSCHRFGALEDSTGYVDVTLNGNVSFYPPSGGMILASDLYNVNYVLPSEYTHNNLSVFRGIYNLDSDTETYSTTNPPPYEPQALSNPTKAGLSVEGNWYYVDDNDKYVKVPEQQLTKELAKYAVNNTLTLTFIADADLRSINLDDDTAKYWELSEKDSGFMQVDETGKIYSFLTGATVVFTPKTEEDGSPLLDELGRYRAYPEFLSLIDGKISAVLLSSTGSGAYECIMPSTNVSVTFNSVKPINYASNNVTINGVTQNTWDATGTCQLGSAGATNWRGEYKIENLVLNTSYLVIESGTVYAITSKDLQDSDFYDLSHSLTISANANLLIHKSPIDSFDGFVRLIDISKGNVKISSLLGCNSYYVFDMSAGTANSITIDEKLKCAITLDNLQGCSAISIGDDADVTLSVASQNKVDTITQTGSTAKLIINGNGNTLIGTNNGKLGLNTGTLTLNNVTLSGYGTVGSLATGDGFVPATYNNVTISPSTNTQFIYDWYEVAYDVDGTDYDAPDTNPKVFRTTEAVTAQKTISSATYTYTGEGSSQSLVAPTLTADSTTKGVWYYETNDDGETIKNVISALTPELLSAVDDGILTLYPTEEQIYSLTLDSRTDEIWRITVDSEVPEEADDPEDLPDDFDMYGSPVSYSIPAGAEIVFTPLTGDTFYYYVACPEFLTFSDGETLAHVAESEGVLYTYTMPTEDATVKFNDIMEISTDAEINFEYMDAWNSTKSTYEIDGVTGTWPGRFSITNGTTHVSTESFEELIKESTDDVTLDTYSLCCAVDMFIAAKPVANLILKEKVLQVINLAYGDVTLKKIEDNDIYVFTSDASDSASHNAITIPSDFSSAFSIENVKCSAINIESGADVTINVIGRNIAGSISGADKVKLKVVGKGDNSILEPDNDSASGPTLGINGGSITIAGPIKLCDYTQIGALENANGYISLTMECNTDNVIEIVASAGSTTTLATDLYQVIYDVGNDDKYAMPEPNKNPLIIRGEYSIADDGEGGGNEGFSSAPEYEYEYQLDPPTIKASEENASDSEAAWYYDDSEGKPVKVTDLTPTVLAAAGIEIDGTLTLYAGPVPVTAVDITIDGIELTASEEDGSEHSVDLALSKEEYEKLLAATKTTEGEDLKLTLTKVALAGPKAEGGEESEEAEPTSAPFSLAAVSDVKADKTTWGYLKANSTFALAVSGEGEDAPFIDLSTWTEEQDTAPAMTITAPPSLAEEEDSTKIPFATLTLYNANAIILSTDAGIVTFTLNCGESTITVNATIHRQASQLNVSVPLVMVMQTNIDGGKVTLPSNSDYHITNNSSMAVELLDASITAVDNDYLKMAEVEPTQDNPLPRDTFWIGLTEDWGDVGRSREFLAAFDPDDTSNQKNPIDFIAVGPLSFVTSEDTTKGLHFATITYKVGIPADSD